jgi:hypothetical protein
MMGLRCFAVIVSLLLKRRSRVPQATDIPDFSHKQNIMGVKSTGTIFTND